MRALVVLIACAITTATFGATCNFTTTAVEGRTFNFTTVAVNGAGVSSPSSPFPFSSITMSSSTAMSRAVYLAWSEPSPTAVSTVTILRNGVAVATYPINATEHYDTGLVASTTYSYQLAAAAKSGYNLGLPPIASVTALPFSTFSVNTPPAFVFYQPAISTDGSVLVTPGSPNGFNVYVKSGNTWSYATNAGVGIYGGTSHYTTIVETNADGTRIYSAGVDNGIFYFRVYDFSKSTTSSTLAFDYVTLTVKGQDVHSGTAVFSETTDSFVLFKSLTASSFLAFSRSGSTYVQVASLSKTVGPTVGIIVASSSLSVIAWTYAWTDCATATTTIGFTSFSNNAFGSQSVINVGVDIGHMAMSANGTRLAIVGRGCSSNVYLAWWSSEGGTWAKLAERTDTDYISLASVAIDPSANRFYVAAKLPGGNVPYVIVYKYVVSGATGAFVRTGVIPLDTGAYVDPVKLWRGAAWVGVSSAWLRPVAWTTSSASNANVGRVDIL